MKLLLLSATVLAVLSSSSCTSGTKEIWSRLEEAERLINIAPDSSLSIISNLEYKKNPSKRMNAERALLHSIALDKKAVDISSDSIILPALSYFSQRGCAEKRSKTFYYTARIYENAGKLEEAMEWLIKAEVAHKGMVNDQFKALIFSTKGRIYNSLHEYQEAEMNYRQASEFYFYSGDTDRYAISKLREGNCAFMYGNDSSAIKTIKEVERLKDKLSVKTLARFYPVMLNIYSRKDSANVVGIMKEYFSQISDNRLIDWLTVSRIYLANKDLKSALIALENQKAYKGRDATYFYLLSQIYEAMDRDTEALSACKEYIRLSGIIGEEIIAQDTRFIEERQQHLIRHEKNREKTVILILSVIASLMALLAALLSMITIRKQLTIRKNEQYIMQTQLDGLLQEREELAKSFVENEEGRRIISERLRIIDNFVFSETLQDSIFEKKASETLKEIISDRERFIRQNRLIFNQSYPEFISFLKFKELTDTEIEHCCLYAIGLNGKMVTNFTNMKRHYHIGSSIRKKLGLNEHDTNISIHIKRLLKDLE